MNFDELMDVWQSQGVSPLHGVNETLVQVALRRHETRLRRVQRVARWILLAVTALVVALMGRYLVTMIQRQDKPLSGFDYAIPIVGAAAAVLFVRQVSVRQRALALEEQHFGESLRGQIKRQFAQLDRASTTKRAASLLGTFLLPVICAVAFVAASWRISGRSIVDTRSWMPIVFVLCWITFRMGAGHWGRRWLQQKTLPRRHRLQALLDELEAEV